MAADNKSLGKFILDGIPPAPRGVPQIEVTFDIDANGILHVTARDKASGRSQHITIAASSGLSDAEVEQMRKDAEAHAEEDLQHKELIEARNKADNMAYAAEKAIKDQAEKIPAQLRAEVESLVGDLRLSAQGSDVAAMTAATKTLGDAIQKIGAAAYRQPDGTPADDGKAPQSTAGPEVVEGEVKE
jgi:molecular chaperone DnaK